MADQPASKTSTLQPARPDHRTASQRGIRRTAIACVAVTAAMLGAAYAAVPLYDLFCKVTGYGGTPRIATECIEADGPARLHGALRRKCAAGPAWRFEPERPASRLSVGETQTVFYKIRNCRPARP